MPYLLITNGPTGSGKSGLVRKTLDFYKLDPSYETFLIDDLIENNDFYKKQIDNLIVQECKSRTLCPVLREKMNNPDENLYKKFGDIYFKTRGKTGEKFCNNMTCDDLIDQMLDDAINRKVNIVFETVGTYYISWLIDKIVGTYDVYYAFTVLDFCENVRRNKTRAASQMGDYVQDRRKPAPRLPNVEEKHFEMIVKDIGKNLWSLMGRKTFGDLDDVEHIIVFDNTGRDINVLYESDRDSSQANLFAAIEKIKQTQRIRRCYMRS